MDGLQEPVAASKPGRLTDSLRFKLSLWLSVAIVLIAAAAGTLSFVSTLDEAHQQQDNQLRQTGYLISRLDAVPASPLAREKRGDIDFDARVVVRFLPTPGLPDLPRPVRPPEFSSRLVDGLQTVSVGREQWRVFVKTNDKGVRVAVAQQTTVRDAAARASALRTLMPILILGPVLVLLASVLVQQMFKPLKRLSDELRRRPEHDLGTLDGTGLPSEVRPFVLQINELLDRVGRAMAMQRRFIADAAHELRSPMTAMSLQAERLGTTEMPGEARVRLGALIAGLHRTRELLDQLLTMARIQESGPEVAGSVSLAAIVREVLEDLVPLAAEKNIDLGVIGDADAQIEAQAVDLRVLVANLVDNAIRYTPEGGRVDITVSRAQDQVTLQVDDTGPGIPADERERVFDPFYRILGNGEIGSGLGLAITRSVAANMGAHIELSDADAVRGGLRARVTFRAASDDGGAATITTPRKNPLC